MRERDQREVTRRERERHPRQGAERLREIGKELSAFV